MKLKALGNLIIHCTEWLEENIKLTHRKKLLKGIHKNPCNAKMSVNDVLVITHYGIQFSFIPTVYANTEHGIIINSKMKEIINQRTFSSDALNAMIWHEYGHLDQVDRHLAMVRSGRGDLAEFEADDYAIKNGYGLGMIEILEWYKRYHDGIGQQLLQYRINRILYGELDYL